MPRTSSPAIYAELEWAGRYPALDQDRVDQVGGQNDFPLQSDGTDNPQPFSALDDYLALPAGSPGLAVAQQYVGDPNGFLSALATRDHLADKAVSLATLFPIWQDLTTGANQQRWQQAVATSAGDRTAAAMVAAEASE